MSHVAIADAAAAVAIQPGAAVSKVIYRNEDLNVTVFGFDAGEGLTEHQAARAAIVQVMAGRLRFVADGEELDAGPGFWLHMTPGTPHSLVAAEPTVNATHPGWNLTVPDRGDRRRDHGNEVEVTG